MKLLLILPLITVIAVNGLSTKKFSNGHQDHDYDHGIPESGDEPLQRKEMNLVDGDEDSTDEDDKGHIEIELQNGSNTTAQPSWDCESHGGECKKNKQCNGTISIEYTCSKNGVCCIVESNAKSNSELTIQMLSNAILIQGMAIRNQENLLKNLTNTIANLKMTIEVMNSNLTYAISDARSTLQVKISNLSDAISNEGMALQINQDSIMSNLSDGFSNQENMLESMKDNQDIIMSNLTHIARGCPEGFFVVADHCFKLYTDTTRSWTAAKSKCASEGLRMAEINNPIPLMDTLVTTMGVNWYTWLGAKGDDSYVRWQSDNKIIPSGSSNYWTHYLTRSDYCVIILSTSGGLSSYRTNPFQSVPCTSSCNTLCEYV